MSLFPPKTPKTPSRQRARSEVRTPLTPSLLAAMNSVSLAATPSRRPRVKSKPSAVDISNPFIATKSRPSSPVKRTASTSLAVSGDLSRQASGGVIRKGGVESRLDVVTLDYVPPKKAEMKRSRSTPAAGRDRFITTREADTDFDIAATMEKLTINPGSSSPGHTARLINATGVPANRRILGYHEAPPAPSTDTSLAQQRECAKPLYARPAALPTSTGATTNKSRKITTQPERVLDAPGLADDFYLHLLSWSCHNVVAVALEGGTYVWKADTGSVTQLGEPPEGTYVASVSFSNDGMFLGIGLGNGSVELWDVENGRKLRTMAGHQAQVATLSWHQHLLSSGCADGSIWHHDVRVPQHKVMELLGHSGEVCGLKWRSDGELLASGGNDNVVNIWDGRVGDVGEGARGQAKWTKRNHTAAVKALDWCSWQPNLLASGGGTNDATINIWNSTTGARLHTQQTPAQITSVIWSPSKKELLTTHGFPTNAIMIHAYPNMERVAEIRDAHASRVLYSALSPSGDLVCTAADENLRLWRIWDVASEGVAKKKKTGEGHRRINSTSSSNLAIR